MKVKRTARGYTIHLTKHERVALLCILTNAPDEEDTALDGPELAAFRRIAQWGFAGGPEGAWNDGGPPAEGRNHPLEDDR